MAPVKQFESFKAEPEEQNSGGGTAKTWLEVLFLDLLKYKKSLASIREILKVSSLRPDCTVYGMLSQWMTNSRGNGPVPIILHIFKIDRIVERERFNGKSYTELGLHGTRPANVAQILENGLKGGKDGTFGTGVYSTPTFEYVFQYSHPDNMDYNYTFVVEIHPGKCLSTVEWMTPQRRREVAREYDTIKGIGNNIPGPKTELYYGATVYIDETIKRKVTDTALESSHILMRLLA